MTSAVPRLGCTRGLARSSKQHPKSRPRAPSSAPDPACLAFAVLVPANAEPWPPPAPSQPHAAPRALHHACEPRPRAPHRARAASFALTRWQLRSRSYLALIKTIPGWKEPKGRFPRRTGLAWVCGMDAVPALPTARGPPLPSPAGRRRLLLSPGLFLAPVKRERQRGAGRQSAGRCRAAPGGTGQEGAGGPFGHPPAPAPPSPAGWGRAPGSPQPREGNNEPGALTPRSLTSAPPPRQPHHRGSRSPSGTLEADVCLSSSPAWLVLMAHPPPRRARPTREPSTSCLPGPRAASQVHGAAGGAEHPPQRARATGDKNTRGEASWGEGAIFEPIVSASLSQRFQLPHGRAKAAATTLVTKVPDVPVPVLARHTVVADPLP